MQTFLPYESYETSAQVLDRARLGKQRVEAYQILRVLLGITTGWQHHPAVRMWRGHEHALVDYTLAVCDEWTWRGYRDSVADNVRQLVLPPSTPPQHFDLMFRLSHQSNLVRKNAAHYRPHFPDVPDNLPYVWPG